MERRALLFLSDLPFPTKERLSCSPSTSFLLIILLLLLVVPLVIRIPLLLLFLSSKTQILQSHYKEKRYSIHLTQFSIFSYFLLGRNS